MRISDWSSDVCSSDLAVGEPAPQADRRAPRTGRTAQRHPALFHHRKCADLQPRHRVRYPAGVGVESVVGQPVRVVTAAIAASAGGHGGTVRSEEHTSELQSLMRISYAVFCLKKKTKK